jgi:putative DNA methylase
MADISRGWYSRGYLPHYDGREKLQLITYRLYDALPAEVIARIGEQGLDDARRREALDRCLDVGYGSCLLRGSANAEIVRRGWHHFDGSMYRLHAWCVMPNHVHVLIAPGAGCTLGGIVQSQKSYSAKAILRRIAGSGGGPPA